MKFFSTLREIVWGKPAATKEERRLVVKLDLTILTFVCLMYWVNYLDRSNLNNAYVSGLKEDLSMYGTELNQINSVFYVGYTLGQIPNNLALQKVPPHLYFAIAIGTWGIFTLGTAFVTTWQQVMAIRFCQGIFESATFVGTHYVLGSWYNSEELGKRTAIFAASGVAGNMFSGILQGSIYTNLCKLYFWLMKLIKAATDGSLQLDCAVWQVGVGSSLSISSSPCP